MLKNMLLRKGLAVAVIFSFIGVAFAPSINADLPDVEEKTVEPKEFLFQTIIDIANNPEVKDYFENTLGESETIAMVESVKINDESINHLSNIIMSNNRLKEKIMDLSLMNWDNGVICAILEFILTIIGVYMSLIPFMEIILGPPFVILYTIWLLLCWPGPILPACACCP